MGPRVIILDEPTAGQDYTSYREFMTYLDDIKKTGVGVILITHDMHLALDMPTAAWCFSGGRVIAKDYIDRILPIQPLSQGESEAYLHRTDGQALWRGGSQLLHRVFHKENHWRRRRQVCIYAKGRPP